MQQRSFIDREEIERFLYSKGVSFLFLFPHLMFVFFGIPYMSTYEIIPYKFIIENHLKKEKENLHFPHHFLFSILTECFNYKDVWIIGYISREKYGLFQSTYSMDKVNFKIRKKRKEKELLAFYFYFLFFGVFVSICLFDVTFSFITSSSYCSNLFFSFLFFSVLFCSVLFFFFF